MTKISVKHGSHITDRKKGTKFGGRQMILPRRRVIFFCRVKFGCRAARCIFLSENMSLNLSPSQRLPEFLHRLPDFSHRLPRRLCRLNFLQGIFPSAFQKSLCAFSPIFRNLPKKCAMFNYTITRHQSKLIEFR